MNESQISVRYAKALFRSASEKQILDQVYRDMELLSNTCKMEEFKYMLVLPSLQASQKCKFMDALFKASMHPASMSMINLVIRNKRELYLPGIARNFKDLYRNAKGIRTASLITAQPVDEEALTRIRDMLARAFDSEVELTSGVDEGIIGGFILNIEKLQYDASVATSLKKMKKQLLESSIEKI